MNERKQKAPGVSLLLPGPRPWLSASLRGVSPLRAVGHAGATGGTTLKGDAFDQLRPRPLPGLPAAIEQTHEASKAGGQLHRVTTVQQGRPHQVQWP